MSETNLTPDESNDIQEFLDKSETFKEKQAEVESAKSLLENIFGLPIESTNEDQPKKKSKPGKVTQYSLHGKGYAPATSTIDVLPPGCYDIVQDQVTCFAVPTKQRSGLLLELPEMRSEEVIKTVNVFWESEKDYKDGNEYVIGGAAFKSGIMIFGPPGSGKSCTLALVANKLVERGGTVFYADGHPLSIRSFLKDFSTIEENRKCIVILEDFDSLIQNHGEAVYLEMLDSAKSINNVMFIATTNYPERLDPRIYNRPGRFSHVIKIGLPKAKTREAYLKAILKKHTDIPEIVDKTDGFTIDHLTSLINAVYREKKNLPKEIERLRALFKMPKSTEDKVMGFGASSVEDND